MTCRPRSDLFMNLPALRKLDNMLLVSSNLDCFIMYCFHFWKSLRSLFFVFSNVGHIRQFHQYRVLVCRSRSYSPRSRWLSLFPQNTPTARGEVVATCTSCGSRWSQWKFKKAVASHTGMHKSNTKSCYGYQQHYSSRNGSSRVVHGNSPQGLQTNIGLYF